ncbi:kinase-like domain-containing protein [Dipodascopsis uninucleata]
MATVFAFDEPEINGDFRLMRSRSISSVISKEDMNVYGESSVGTVAIPETPGKYKVIEEGLSIDLRDDITEKEDTNGSSLKDQKFKDEEQMATSYRINIESDYVASYAEDVTAISSARKLSPSDFESLKVLGKGAYGKVLLVRERATGRLFAQKQLKKASMIVHKKSAEQTQTERAILESVRHPYIVKLFYALQDKHKLYLLLEYAQGGELFHHLMTERMLSEDTVSFYVAELVLALSHLHTVVGVVYRDLKPENCLLDSKGHLVLTDFGLSKVANDDGTCRTFLGTPEYMAPEVLLGKPYDFAVDWWSLGALCYDLLTGSPPFTGNNHKRIIEKILKTKLSLPYYLSPDAKDFLTRLLRKEPKKRLGGKLPHDIQIIKKHRFFRKLDWKRLEARDSDLIPPIVPIITDPILAENFSEEFTNMAMTPPVDEFSMGQPSPNDLTFENFTFTASKSFFEDAIRDMSIGVLRDE